LTALVVPGASKTELKGTHGGALRIRVAAPPEAGKANRALLQFLAKLTGCNVSLARGVTSRRKLVHIESGELHRVAEQLGLEKE